MHGTCECMVHGNAWHLWMHGTWECMAHVNAWYMGMHSTCKCMAHSQRCEPCHQTSPSHLTRPHAHAVKHKVMAFAWLANIKIMMLALAILMFIVAFTQDNDYNENYFENGEEYGEESGGSNDEAVFWFLLLENALQTNDQERSTWLDYIRRCGGWISLEGQLRILNSMQGWKWSWFPNASLYCDVMKDWKLLI